MQKFFQICSCLLLFLLLSFSVIAQISDKKNKRLVYEKGNKLTNNDYKEIVKLIDNFPK